MDKQPTPHFRSFSYIGGFYNGSGTYSNQMYVEQLSPLLIKKNYPIVLVHGGGQTGTSWLNKPDGGLGWADWFLKKGYQVYIVDQPSSGRSPLDQNALTKATRSMSTKFIEERFTNTSENKLWPQADLHNQWPGTGKKGDPIFDAYYASTTPFLDDSSKQEERVTAAGIALLDKIGPVIILTHSQGSLAGWLWADSRPNLVKALIQIEPREPPFYKAIFENSFAQAWGLTSTPLHFDPASSTSSSTPLRFQTMMASSPEKVDGFLQAEPARKLINLKNIPILIETGEASYHAVYDHWTVHFLQQAGCEKVEHLKLADIGIHGNGHLQMLEKNSDAIVEALENWIENNFI